MKTTLIVILVCSERFYYVKAEDIKALLGV